MGHRLPSYLVSYILITLLLPATTTDQLLTKLKYDFLLLWKLRFVLLLFFIGIKNIPLIRIVILDLKSVPTNKCVGWADIDAQGILIAAEHPAFRCIQCVDSFPSVACDNQKDRDKMIITAHIFLLIGK